MTYRLFTDHGTAFSTFLIILRPARMDAFKELAALGLELPSPAYLIGASLFGIIGWIAFRRGRKITTASLTWAGLALMLFAYAVSQTWLLWIIGAALSGWVYLKWSK